MSPEDETTRDKLDAFVARVRATLQPGADRYLTASTAAVLLRAMRTVDRLTRTKD